MLRAVLTIETYKRFLAFLPNRLRMALKRYIDAERTEWAKLGYRTRQLAETPYQLNLDMRHWHQRWTYIKGYYPEPHITGLIASQLKAESIFIDIGANIGVHSLFAAAKIANPHQVWAIEPNPHSFARLSTHAKLNQLDAMQLYQVALGNQNGTIRLHNCDDAHVGSTLRNGGDGGCEVSIQKGDDLFASIPSSAQGICKIDVEGYELEVLRGLQQFISSHPRISYIIEVTPKWLESLGDSTEALFQVFFAQGFQAYEIQDKLLPLLQPIDKSQYDVFFSQKPL
jgi:FkbM family methyltransferase